MRYPPSNLADYLIYEAQWICAQILNPEVEKIDIAIRINALREYCLEHAPEKAELFEAVYVGRFNRLWEQWRIED